MKKITLAIFLIVVLIVSTLAFSFKVESLQIDQRDDCVKDEKIASALSIYGQSIFLTSEQKVSKIVKEEFSCAQEVEVIKKYPNTLVINVKIIEPAAIAEFGNYLLFADGTIRETSTKANIPTLFLNANNIEELQSKILSEITLKALKVASILAKSDFNAASIRILEESKIAVYSREDIVTIFSPEKSLEKQVSSLQQVLAESKIDATKIAKIDLSFDKVVIVYK